MKRQNRPTVQKSSTLTLFELLKRRKTTLKAWIAEVGMSTYVAVENYCTRMGVIPPSEEQFKRVSRDTVTDQANGVIVLDTKREHRVKRAKVQPTVDTQSDPRKNFDGSIGSQERLNVSDPECTVPKEVNPQLEIPSDQPT